MTIIAATAAKRARAAAKERAKLIKAARVAATVEAHDRHQRRWRGLC